MTKMWQVTSQNTVSITLAGKMEKKHGKYDLSMEITSCRLATRELIANSGVTTRGEVRQLPQGTKRQGALLVDGLFALHYRIPPNF